MFLQSSWAHAFCAPTVHEPALHADDDPVTRYAAAEEDLHFGVTVQVARSLMELYSACLRNDASVLQQLRQRPATGAAASKKQVVRRAAVMCQSCSRN